MATIKEYFSQAIQKGMNAADKITDKSDQAKAYAALASAMAQTGIIAPASLDETVSEPAAEEPKGKDALKPETNKKAPAPVPKKPEKKAEPEPEEAQEPELTEEWTDEMFALKKEQIDYIQTLKDDYEESTLNECAKVFSEGTFETLDDITPLNIDAFVAFMQAQVAQAAQAAE